MIRCARCGQELPARAHFCARCGAAVNMAPAWSPTPTVPPPPSPPPGSRTLFGAGAQPETRAESVRRGSTPVWLLVLFYAGAVVPLFLGVVYTVAATDPRLANPPGSGYSDATVQASATTFAAVLLGVCAAQVVAAFGLTFNQGWGRIVATFVCLAWMVTLVGIPVSVIALSAIWHRSQA